MQLLLFISKVEVEYNFARAILLRDSSIQSSKCHFSCAPQTPQKEEMWCEPQKLLSRVVLTNCPLYLFPTTILRITFKASPIIGKMGYHPIFSCTGKLQGSIISPFTSWHNMDRILKKAQNCSAVIYTFLRIILIFSVWFGKKVKNGFLSWEDFSRFLCTRHICCFMYF